MKETLAISNPRDIIADIKKYNYEIIYNGHHYELHTTGENRSEWFTEPPNSINFAMVCTIP